MHDVRTPINKKAAGRAATAARTNQPRPYHTKPAKSRPCRKIPPGRPDRRPPQPPANATAQAMTWTDRAALSMLALAGNMQEGQHLSARDRAQGWGVFAALCRRFVASRIDAQAGAAA